MDQIAVAEFSREECLAVLAALRRKGIAPARVCVSKLGVEGGELAALFAMVSAPGWVGAYECGEGWTARLEQDLEAARAA